MHVLYYALNDRNWLWEDSALNCEMQPAQKVKRLSELQTLASASCDSALANDDLSIDSTALHPMERRRTWNLQVVAGEESELDLDQNEK